MNLFSILLICFTISFVKYCQAIKFGGKKITDLNKASDILMKFLDSNMKIDMDRFKAAGYSCSIMESEILSTYSFMNIKNPRVDIMCVLQDAELKGNQARDVFIAAKINDEFIWLNYNSSSPELCEYSDDIIKVKETIKWSPKNSNRYNFDDVGNMINNYNDLILVRGQKIKSIASVLNSKPDNIEQELEKLISSKCDGKAEIIQSLLLLQVPVQVNGVIQILKHYNELEDILWNESSNTYVETLESEIYTPRSEMSILSHLIDHKFRYGALICSIFGLILYLFYSRNKPTEDDEKIDAYESGSVYNSFSNKNGKF